MSIIDFHVHPFLDAESNSCMYKGGHTLTAQEARRELERAGIGHICGCVIEPGRFERAEGWRQLQRLNEKALQLQLLYGDYYTPGFHIHPAYPEASLETLALIYERGYRLIGELVPYMHGWAEYGLDYGSDALGRLLERAGQYGMLVNFHTMNEQQEAMEVMVAEHPDVIFVAAHPGEREVFVRHLQRMEKYDNLYLDLSGTGLFRYGMLRAGVEAVGAGRFLFGTDYPITNPAMYVEAVRFEHISDEARADIFYHNAHRLLYPGS